MNTIDVVRATASSTIEDAGVEYAVIKWSILDTLYHSPDVRKTIYTGNKIVGDYKYASFNVIPKDISAVNLHVMIAVSKERS